MIAWTPEDYHDTVLAAAKHAAAQQRKERLLDAVAVAMLLLTCAGLGCATYYLMTGGLS